MANALKTWRSCDLKSVAFLLYEGFAVAEVGLENGRVFFEFEETDKRKEALLGFWNKAKTVEPVAFIDALNRARDMVTQALRA